LLNVNTGEIGSTAVGFRGKFVRSFRKEIQIIKIDPISEEPLRDKNGFCVKVYQNKMVKQARINSLI
jgi:hypothetical protein